MAKSFANRFLLMGLFSLLVFGNILHDSYAAVINCSVGSYKFLDDDATVYACATERTSSSTCNDLVTYDVYRASDGQQIFGYTSCENFVSASQAATVGTKTTQQCEPDSTTPVTISMGAGGVTFNAFGCCGAKTYNTQSAVTKGTRYTTAKNKYLYDVLKGGMAVYDASCSGTISTAYSCVCSDPAFSVQSQGTSSCNCGAYASGYSCYVASCTGTQQGATTTFVGNHYISDDRKSCAACPTGTESTVSAANKIYYSDGTGPVVWTGRVGEQINNSAFAKIGVTSCYQPSDSASTPNSFQDGNGNMFTLSSNCNYTK